jgi:hypothetical protein
MPTYEDLREFYDGQKQMQDLAGQAARNTIVQGITIDADPLWARLYDLETRLVPQGVELLDEDKDAFGLPWMARFRGFRRRDLTCKFERWEEIQNATRRSFGRERLPVTMTIVHRPLRPPLAGEEEQTDELEELRSLVRLVDESGLLVRVEEQPPAHFAFQAGGKIQRGIGGSGTLGGVLQDPVTGKSYGLTCEHVATKNDTVMDSAQNTIGKCIEATVRVPVPGTITDPIMLAKPNPYPGNGPDMNVFDCSIIEFSTVVTAPPLGGVAGALSTGQWVTVSGAQSTSYCYLGALAISYSFTEAGKKYCFCDSIELIPRPTGLLGGVPGQLLAPPPKKGDSGAWVLIDDSPPIWAGLLYAANSQKGFAIRASWVFDWAKKAVSQTLTV